MDVTTATEQILLLSSINEEYLSQLKTLNSQIQVDDINDINFLNKNYDSSKSTLNSYLSIKDQARTLCKKIQDNCAAMNIISSQVVFGPGYFDNSELLAQYRAKILSCDLPQAVDNGVNVTLNLNIQNIGFASWIQSKDVKLQVTIKDIESYSDTFTTQLSSNDNIGIGATKEFSTVLTMPTSSGQYNVVMQMYVGSTAMNFPITQSIYVA